jgi:protein SCO1/2
MDDLGRDVPVIGISVDPANDTARSARTFLLEQHMTGRMRFALGTAAELRPVWEAFGVAPQRDGKEHSASVVVVDGDLRQRIGYRPSYLTVDGLAGDLRRIGA